MRRSYEEAGWCVIARVVGFTERLRTSDPSLELFGRKRRPCRRHAGCCTAVQGVSRFADVKEFASGSDITKGIGVGSVI